MKNYGNLLPHRQPLTPGGEPVCARRPGPHPDDPCFIHPHDHRFNDRCLVRSRKDYVFALTDYPSEETATGESGEVTVRCASSVATYGYDGLSAYQIAVMRGDFSGTEGEFLAQSGFTKLKTINGESLIGEGDIQISGGSTLETATETKLGGIRAATKTQAETVEVKIDPATGKLYVPESEAEALEAATETKLGGIKASAKTENETVEAKIGPDGKLYVPKGGEELKTATETTLGGIKASAKTDNETVEAKIGSDGKLYVPKGGEELKTATETTLGGIKAATKTSLETQEVKIDPVTGKLYTQPGGEGGTEIVNNPDEEDLHSVEKSADVHVLQFADKEYNASAFSGLGRVYLRKNISSSKNVLTQAMMSKANTRYIIQYDYDLNGETITVPEGCTLDFQGGSLKNGTIKGTNTAICDGLQQIFGLGMTLSGSWNLKEIYPEWFGAVGDGKNDDYLSLQEALYTANMINIKKVSLSRSYYISSTINVYNGTILDATGIYETWNPPSIIVNNISAIKLIPQDNTCRVRIRNFNIINTPASYANYAIYVEPENDSELLGISQSLFENLLIEGFKEGIYLHISGSQGLYTTTFRQVHIGKCVVGIHIKGSIVGSQTNTWANYNKIESCVISHCKVGAIWFDGLKSTAVFHINYCDIESNGPTCDQSLFEEYGGCFGFKFSSVDGPCIISNCYLESNIPMIDGALVSDDLNHSALFVGYGMYIEVHSCLITSYRRVVLSHGYANINFHDNRWGSEYNNQGLSDSLIKIKGSNYFMGFTSIRFREIINTTYSIRTGVLFSVDDYNLDTNSSVSCIAVDIDCNKFGTYKSGFDGKRKCSLIYVDAVKGNKKATGFTKEDALDSLFSVFDLLYLSKIEYGDKLSIAIIGEQTYNSDNDTFRGLLGGINLTAGNSRDTDRLIVEGSHGIICKNGYVTISSLTLSYGESCDSLFRMGSNGVNLTMDYCIVESAPNKNFAYNVSDGSSYKSYRNCSLLLKNITVNGDFQWGDSIYGQKSDTVGKLGFEYLNAKLPSGVNLKDSNEES